MHDSNSLLSLCILVIEMPLNVLGHQSGIGLFFHTNARNIEFIFLSVNKSQIIGCKECVAVLTGLYKKNGAVSCVKLYSKMTDVPGYQPELNVVIYN